ncbi:MAG TPA: acyltransferase [Accumulibacter sp.]|nr:acyltransferase [Accumulibacter sp.]HMY05576.1 acyltransferase [Accumulibacter sp.]HNL14320.1 acyltransferase [Accumulibacter sp.]HNL78103.1 acyltransferase [Accumulibacter sp.]
MNWLSQRFELSRGGAAANVRPMEGLRGFAVFLVFIVHFVTLVTPWLTGNPDFLAFTRALHSIGNTGVDVFFVLSGYLIYSSLISRHQSFPRFMARRVQRLYPAFIVVFVIYLLLSFLFSAESKIPRETSGAIIYLLQNFLLLPGLFPIEPMITVAWSLSYEMFYYLTLPLVIGLFGLRERSPLWRGVFFLSVALATALYCAINGGPVRLIMFIAGILVYEAMNIPGLFSPHRFFGLLGLAAGLLCMLLPLPGSAGATVKIGILFIAYFTVCLSCFRHPSSGLARSFSWTPLRWLGNMSYSYYLLHGLALKAAFMGLPVVLPIGSHGPALFWGLMPLMFAATLVPTALLFLLIERPLSLSPHRGGATRLAPASTIERPLTPAKPKLARHR